MRLKNFDLILTAEIAAVNVIWALLPYHIQLVGIILALPLVFALPGYALSEVLFRRRSLETSHRLLLSLVLSIVIDIAGGFLLNLLPGGLQAVPWALYLALLTIALCGLAWYLRSRRQEPEGHVLQLPRLSLTSAALLTGALLIAVLAVLYSANSAAQQPRPGFTQLWIQPANRTENTCAVQFGIQSFETTNVSYRVTMTTNSGGTLAWSPITLAPHQTWSLPVSIAAPTTGNKATIEVRLYRLDDPGTVYRHVDMTFYVIAGKAGGTPQCSLSPNS